MKNHKLAKSISDAAWSQFAEWLQYFGKVYGKTVVAVAPQYTSVDCSTCGNTVKKSPSQNSYLPVRCGIRVTPQCSSEYFSEGFEASRNQFKYGEEHRN